MAEEIQNLQYQKAAFETERQTLANWATERDQAFAAREGQLHRQSQALESRDIRWRSLRDQWTQEKLEAEQIIRDLLDQLESETRNQGPEVRGQKLEVSGQERLGSSLD